MSSLDTALVGGLIALVTLDLVLLFIVVVVHGTPFRIVWDEWKRLSRKFWLGGW